jgi:septation ring formation regulator EzrA
MITFIISLIVIVIAFASGFYAGVKNAKSQKVEKTIDIIKALKSKD